MGRRNRQRQNTTAAAPAKPAAPATRMARVQASDDVWADFRALAGYRPIAEVLGELVEREVDRYRSRRLKDNTLEPRELIDALDRAHAQQQDLQVIVERFETLRQTPTR
jgi:hypothetical protein